MTDIRCARCGASLVRKQRSKHVWHYTCPDPDCQPPREPRWRFVLGLVWEVGVLVPLGALKALYARVRGS